MKTLTATLLLLLTALLVAKVSYRERLVADKYGYAFGLAAADLDGDGDLDFTSADATKNSLCWYENDGQGKFRRHYVRNNESGWFERHEIGDIDKDGRPDIVVVKNLHNHIVWFRNSGKPKKHENWQRHVVTTRLPSAYDVTIADFDGDGDLDVAASSWIRGRRFSWYENDGTPSEGEWKGRVIEGNLQETREVQAADIDGDGDPDIMATDAKLNLLLWYENTGKPTGRWKKHVITQSIDRPNHGSAIDMDGDGDLDVLMAFGSFTRKRTKTPHQIAWFENRQGRWVKHLVCKLVNAAEAAAADLDGDGDIDVVASAWGATTGQVLWVENRGPGKPWTTHKLKSPWSKANSIVVADFNGDKRPDILASAERGANEVRVWLSGGK